MTRRKGGHLMPADRLARIAYELCAVAPDPPLFLTAMMGGNPALDIVVDQPLGLIRQLPHEPKGTS